MNIDRIRSATIKLLRRKAKVKLAEIASKNLIQSSELKFQKTGIEWELCPWDIIGSTSYYLKIYFDRTKNFPESQRMSQSEAFEYYYNIQQQEEKILFAKVWTDTIDEEIHICQAKITKLLKRVNKMAEKEEILQLNLFKFNETLKILKSIDRQQYWMILETD